MKLGTITAESSELSQEHADDDEHRNPKEAVMNREGHRIDYTVKARVLPGANSMKYNLPSTCLCSRLWSSLAHVSMAHRCPRKPSHEEEGT